MRSAMDARHSSTVSNSPRISDTHSSVTSGSTISCTAVTVTVKSASSVIPLGMALKDSSSPAEVPARRSSNPSATQPLPTSYSQSSVLRPGTGSPSRVAASVRVTWSPWATGRSASSRLPWRRRSASTASSISSSVATGLGSSTRRPP